MPRTYRGKEVMAECPNCGAELIFAGRPRLTQTFTCIECDTLLEVVNLTPLELDWAYEEFEDEEDDDEDAYEEKDADYEDEDDFWEKDDGY
jgi:lysine biosynthesis protein LysW